MHNNKKLSVYLIIFYISAILLLTSRWRNGICVYLDTASSHFSNTQFASFSVILWAKFQIKSPIMKSKTKSNHLVKIPTQNKNRLQKYFRVRVACYLFLSRFLHAWTHRNHKLMASLVYHTGAH